MIYINNEQICGQSAETNTKTKIKAKGKNKDSESGTTTANKIDYGPTIKQIQDQLSKLNLNVFEQHKEKYNTEMSNAKKELNKISKRLDNYENTQKGLDEYQRLFDLTNKAVNDLSARIDKVEISTFESAQQATSSSDKMDSKIAKLSSSMTTKMNEDKTEIEKIKSDIKRLEKMIETSMARSYDDMFKKIKDRFNKLENQMRKYDTNLQTVYESTIGFVFNRWSKKGLDYLADFGELCVNIGNFIVDKIKSIDWKSYYYYYYDKITDPKQQKLFKEWIFGVINYITFWWKNGIQPAIIRQATELYVAVETGTKDIIQFVHTHILYQTALIEVQPYLDMV